MTEIEDAVIVTRPADHVALVTLNRPQARNAINGAVAQGLERAVLETEADPDIWVVVLTGAGGKAFCAGADLKAISQGGARELSTKAGGFAGFVNAARTKPWIAAVDGAALAGGFEIVLSCDMVVASDDATFGLPEVKRGLAAIAGGLFKLPRALPRHLALELVATGEPINAYRATALGLVNRTVPKAGVLSSALDLAQIIAANAPIAVRESLGVARQAYDLTSQEAMAESSAAGARLAKTEDYREGPLAFIEKRAPRWTGR